MHHADVALDQVSKSYAGTAAVDGVSLAIAKGEFVTLLGPSGCGKTTLLRMIAGFSKPDTGRIWVGGRDVTQLPPQQRSVALVFQNYALFPHLTVGENVGFGLAVRHIDRDKMRQRVRECLEIVGLPHTIDRHPHQLSGGEQQRVALARALAVSPSVILMDEPLGALDAKLRVAMQREIKRIQLELGVTTLYVTHDQEEALHMSDRIAVLSSGRVQQLGTPREIYRRPANRFVADFVGRANLIPGTFHPGPARVVVDGGTAFETDADDGAYPAGTRVVLAIRPEAIRFVPPSSSGTGADGTVERAVFSGSLIHYYVRLNDGLTLMVEAQAGEAAVECGTRVGLAWRPGDAITLTAGEEAGP